MLNGVSLQRLYESHGPVQVCSVINKAILEGKISPSDFSLKELAVTFCGEQWYDNLKPDNHSGYRPTVVLENEAVDTSAFQNILGQVIFSRILQAYNEAGSALDALIRIEPTKFASERIFGMTPILGDVGEHVVHEGEPYPEYGFGEDWIQTPETEKRGGIVSITRELIYFDRTGEALRRAGTVGTALGYNKRLRWVDVLIGFVNNYNQQGTVYNTYLTSGAWINKKTGTELVDWTDIDEGLALFAGQVEPYNDHPVIPTNPNTMIVMPPKEGTARRLLSQSQLEVTTAAGNQTYNSPYAGRFNLISDYLIYNREILRNATNADKRWYLGDPREAFAYFENWAIGVRTQGIDSTVSFERDIQLRYRADERGVAGVTNPRAIAQLTN
jgi:hypothetical protein